MTEMHILRKIKSHFLAHNSFQGPSRAGTHNWGCLPRSCPSPTAHLLHCDPTKMSLLGQPLTHMRQGLDAAAVTVGLSTCKCYYWTSPCADGSEHPRMTRQPTCVLLMLLRSPNMQSEHKLDRYWLLSCISSMFQRPFQCWNSSCLLRAGSSRLLFRGTASPAQTLLLFVGSRWVSRHRLRCVLNEQQFHHAVGSKHLHPFLAHHAHGASTPERHSLPAGKCQSAQTDAGMEQTAQRCMALESWSSVQVHRLLKKFRASRSRLGRVRNRKENEGDSVEGVAGFSLRSISAAGLKEDFEKKAQSPPGRAASPAALPTSHFL